MNLGQHLKAQRLQKGYTQEELAKQLMVSRQTILNWEKERTLPDSENLLRLANLYQVPVETLLGAEKPQTTNLSPNHLGRYLVLLVVLLVGCLVSFKGIPVIPVALFGLLLCYIGSEVYHTKLKRWVYAPKNPCPPTGLPATLSDFYPL